MRTKVVLIILSLLYIAANTLNADENYQLARLHYTGGGDWYNDPDAIPNLVNFLNDNISTSFSTSQAVVKATQPNLFDYPFIFMTGHGNILFSDQEVHQLRDYLLRGGFLYADDDYGMDEAFRREIRKIFPDRQLIELPASHEIFNCYYSFPKGIPKIHEHDGKRPQAFAVFDDYGRMMVLYTYETNVSDGWSEAHDNPPEVVEQAFEMGANMMYYLMAK